MICTLKKADWLRMKSLSFLRVVKREMILSCQFEVLLYFVTLCNKNNWPHYKIDVINIRIMFHVFPHKRKVKLLIFYSCSFTKKKLGRLQFNDKNICIQATFSIQLNHKQTHSFWSQLRQKLYKMKQCTLKFHKVWNRIPTFNCFAAFLCD